MFITCLVLFIIPTALVAFTALPDNECNSIMGGEDVFKECESAPTLSQTNVVCTYGQGTGNFFHCCTQITYKQCDGDNTPEPCRETGMHDPATGIVYSSHITDSFDCGCATTLTEKPSGSILYYFDCDNEVNACGVLDPQVGWIYID
jgi:hypothetical protein